MNTKHFFIRHKTYLQEIPIFLSLIVLATFYIKNINFFPIPNSDIFQYICDARDYYLGMLPGDIHAAPGYSVLLGFFSPFFSFLKYPEIKTGILLNTGGIIASLYLIWKLALERTSYFWATLLFFFLMSNQLLFISAVNTTPEPLMVASVLASVYAFKRSKILGYFFALLAFLIRYESLPLFFTFALLDFFESRPKAKKTKKKVSLFTRVRTFFTDAWKFFVGNKVIWLCLLVIGVWFFTVYYINGLNKIPMRNTYLFEIFDRKEDIPELRFINHFYYIVAGHAQSYFQLDYVSVFLFGANLLFLSLTLFFSFIRKSSVDKSLAVFTVFYMIMHIGFPAYNVRYFLPILFIVLYLFLPVLKQGELVFGNKWIFRAVVLLLIVTSRIDTYTYDLKRYINSDRYHFVEYKWAANWFKEQEWKEKATIISDFTYIYSVYLDLGFEKPNFVDRKRCILEPNLKDGHVDFSVFTLVDNEECKSMACFLKERGITEGRVFLNVTEFGNVQLSKFWDERACFKEVYRRVETLNGLVIYEYDFATCPIPTED